MSASTLAPEATCYYILDGIPRGPVSEEELDAFLADGTLKDQGQVRTPRAPGWQSCEEWRALRDRPAAPPDPAPDAGARKPDAPAGETGPRHACVGCGKDWPESLMLMDAREWRCRPCFQKLSLKAKRKGDGSNWFKRHWKALTALGLLLVTAGVLTWCYRRELFGAAPVASGPPAPWINLPPAQWPALVFTNRADFHRHSTLRGQGVCFVRRADGTLVAVTAAHLLTADVGVVPDMAPSELGASLLSWWAYPPGAPERSVALTGLYGSPGALRGLDVLFLTVAPGANTAATTPLSLTSRETHAGEKVFVVAPNSPADPKAAPGPRQAVFAGQVQVHASGAKAGRLVELHMDPPLVPRDLGGSPVINGDGHLVGVVKGWGDPQDAAGHVNTVIVQGAAAFRELIEAKEPANADQPAKPPLKK